MSWRFAIIIFVVLLVIGPVYAVPAKAGKTSGSSPNVILILVDVLRADRVDAMRNGIQVMPNLSNLAAGSVRFKKTTSACRWTLPAMAAIFTSLHVDAHQSYLASDPLANGFETMAEYLHGVGYATSAVQTNLHHPVKGVILAAAGLSP